MWKCYRSVIRFSLWPKGGTMFKVHRVRVHAEPTRVKRCTRHPVRVLTSIIQIAGRWKFRRPCPSTPTCWLFTFPDGRTPHSTSAQELILLSTPIMNSSCGLLTTVRKPYRHPAVCSYQVARRLALCMMCICVYWLLGYFEHQKNWWQMNFLLLLSWH